MINDIGGNYVAPDRHMYWFPVLSEQHNENEIILSNVLLSGGEAEGKDCREWKGARAAHGGEKCAEGDLQKCKHPDEADGGGSCCHTRRYFTWYCLLCKNWN